MNKQSCKFCGGYTADDKRGNCMACGAPRQHPLRDKDTCVMSSQHARKLYLNVSCGSAPSINMDKDHFMGPWRYAGR